jgi:hypothetical protein
LSAYIRQTRPRLSEFVELWRCQTPDDYRPNKQIIPALLRSACASYEHLDKLLEYAEFGVSVDLTRPMPTQKHRPSNHASAVDRLPVLLRNLRAEQDAGRVLILDSDILSIWPEIHTSPFGVVAKAGADPMISGRTIQDLAFPDALSVNDFTSRLRFIELAYRPCTAVVREILRLRTSKPQDSPVVMAGDVASAFRHVGIHSQSVYLFGGIVPELGLLVIDLFCPFGWTGSPSCYEVFGGAISHIHHRMPAPFATSNFPYHWVDDHICVAASDPRQCDFVESTLRRAMTTVLGARAINEAKFTGWLHQLKVLGLMFDTTEYTVSMPTSKISKAQLAVASTFHASSLSRSAYRSLLGSLRHVATCLRPARSFLQRLRVHERHLSRFHRVAVTLDMQDDLRWWWAILHRPDLNRVPMEYFGDAPPPDFTVEVDASDVGCCALDVTSRRYMCYEYTSTERQLIRDLKVGKTNSFDINFRELLTCAFAAMLWSDRWQPNSRDGLAHVHFRIDNTSAVSWQTRLSSPNPLAQTAIRLLCWIEVNHRVRFSSSHIAGSDNIRADAGSRVAASSSKLAWFTNQTSGWSQDRAPVSALSVEQAWQNICATTPLPIPPTPSIGARLSDGNDGV